MGLFLSKEVSDNFDFFSRRNGQHVGTWRNGQHVGTSQVEIQGGSSVVVHDRPVTVSVKSSKFSICASLTAVLICSLFACMTLSRFLTSYPSLSELLVEPEADDLDLPMPDIAITVSMPNMKEAQLLDYVWPIFTWVNITNAFQNRSDSFAPMDELKWGDECGLEAGYNFGGSGCADDTTPGCSTNDDGAAVWPVFCILGSNRTLKGRFGDHLWSFPSLSLNRCGCSSCGGLSPGLKSLWQREGSGACAPNGTESGLSSLIGLNLWFRFEREDWRNYDTIQPPRGMVAPGQWTWWIYEVLQLKAGEAQEGTKVLVELRQNRATVNSPWALWPGSFERLKRFAWFSWAGYIHSPSGTKSSDFIEESLFAASLRVAWRRRVVDVRYFTLQECLSEMSGSWSISLGLGAWAFIVLNQVNKARQSQRAAPEPPPTRAVVLNGNVFDA